MEQIKIRLSQGLTSYQIKMLAVILMTIDHLGAYGFEIPIFSTYNYQLRLIGRLAMPLFLFCLTESIRHTRSRSRFLLRLYLGAVGTGVFTAVTNFLFDGTVGHFSLNNIFYTYLYVAVYVTLIEMILKAVKTKDWKKGILGAAGIGATVIPHFLSMALLSIPFMDYGLDWNVSMLLKELMESLIMGPWMVEYTLLFVIMGVVMYFAGNKYGKAFVLVCFSLLCHFAGPAMVMGEGAFWEWVNYRTPFHIVFGSLQSKMILAVPIMLLYNGKKGKSRKWFFYWYYPVHRYVISVVVYLYLVFWGT